MRFSVRANGSNRAIPGRAGGQMRVRLYTQRTGRLERKIKMEKICVPVYVRAGYRVRQRERQLAVNNDKSPSQITLSLLSLLLSSSSILFFFFNEVLMPIPTASILLIFFLSLRFLRSPISSVAPSTSALQRILCASILVHVVLLFFDIL